MESSFLQDFLRLLDSVSIDDSAQLDDVEAPSLRRVMEGFEYQRLALGCDLVDPLLQDIAALNEYPTTSYLATQSKIVLTHEIVRGRLRQLVGRDTLGETMNNFLESFPDLEGFPDAEFVAPNSPIGIVEIDLVVDHNTLDAFVLVINRRDEALRDLSVTLNGLTVVSGANVPPGGTSAFATAVDPNAEAWTWEYEYTTDSDGPRADRALAFSSGHLPGTWPYPGLRRVIRSRSKIFSISLSFLQKRVTALWHG